MKRFEKILIFGSINTMKQILESINDAYRTMPGPTIVACSGDHMVVDVFNEMHSRTTSVNFHGIIINTSNIQ